MLTISIHDVEQTTHEELIEYTKEYINYYKKQLKDKNFNIVIQGVGIHKNSKRGHTHINYIMEYDDRQDVANWDKKLNPIIKNNRTKSDIFEMRMSIYKNDNPKYSETIGIGYCLKEYDNFEKIILLDEFIGLTNEDIEQLRYNGHSEYTKQIKKHESDERRREQDENETLSIFNYITEQIQIHDKSATFKFLEDTPYTNSTATTMKEKLRMIKIFILQYYRKKARATHKIKFKAYTVRDLAVNYLTKELEDDYLLGELVDLI